MYSDRIQAKLFAKFRRTSMFDIRVFYLCTEYSYGGTQVAQQGGAYSGGGGYAGYQSGPTQDASQSAGYNQVSSVFDHQIFIPLEKEDCLSVQLMGTTFRYIFSQR